MYVQNDRIDSVRRTDLNHRKGAKIYMKYTSVEAAKNMHKAYLHCKIAFDPKFAQINDTVSFENEEEEFFYKTVSDFFIKRKQMEVMNP